MGLIQYYNLMLCMVMVMVTVVVVVPLMVNSQENYALGIEKQVSRLHFYLHDTVSGNKPSVITIADHETTKNSPSFFGLTAMADDPLTEGPEPSSKLLGRAQGVFASASQEEFTMVMALNLVFSDGEFKGSSLSILGGNPILRDVREMPIIGGTGVFRFASGFAVIKTHWANAATHDLIEEYHVTVMHY